MPLTSDPHAWLCQIYARLRADTKFGLLAPVHQFEALAAEADKESPTKGATMREWTVDAQIAMLKWLSDVTHEQRDPNNEIEVWRVRKGERELRCVALYLPSGIDVRLFEGDDFRRTQLVRDAIESRSLSDVWKQKLEERGWGFVQA
jgi:hypothetical protein